MAGQGSLRAVLGGGGGIPVNSFVDMYETDNIINKEGAVYFKTGYVDTDVASYPDAQKRTWQLPVVSSTGSVIGSAGFRISNMQYRFGRWIISTNDQGSGGNFVIKSTNNFTFSPNVSFTDNYSENIGVVPLWNAAVFVWNSGNSTLYCYVNNSGKRYKTTDGINWTSDAMTTLTTSRYISDVILFGSVYLAITDNGIYSSTDGLAWTLRQSWSITGITFKTAQFFTNNTTVVCMSDEANVYYTTTNGTTWTSVNTPSGYVTKGYGDYGDGKWATVFKSTTTNQFFSATSTDTTTWTIAQTPTSSGVIRWHSVLGQWVQSVGNVYSKNGLDWIYGASTGNTFSAIGGWVIVSNETYGWTSYSTVFTAARSSSLPEVVGVPYSLLSSTGQVTVATSGNKYVRVR